MSVPSVTRFKRCLKCNCTKPVTSVFFQRRSKGSRDGFRLTCKVCRSRQNAEWRARNPDYQREWVARNPNYRDEYYKANIEKFRASWAKWYSANKQTRNEKRRGTTTEQNRRYYERILADPERREEYRSRARIRRTRLKNAEGEHSWHEVMQMYDDQQGLCAYCEILLFGVFHVDHMVPLTRGGENGWKNLAITCPLCNRRKNAKTAEEFMEVLMH